MASASRQPPRLNYRTPSAAGMPWDPHLGSRSGQGLITNPPLVIKVFAAWMPWHPDLGSRRDQGLITNPPLVIKVSAAWMSDQGLITNPPLVIKASRFGCHGIPISAAAAAKA